MNSPINIIQEEWDLIEAYLDLSPVQDQSALLKNKISLIPNFEEKIEHVKKVKEEIENNILKLKIKEFHKDVDTAEDSAPTKNLASRKIYFKTIAYAIAASLILSMGIFWMMNIKSPSEKIFATYFKPDIGLPLKMSASLDYKFYEGMLDYKQENYKDAISKWQILWEENPNSDTLNYFLGVANLAQGNTDQALAYLSDQTHFQESIFKEDAAYYAALAKIKEGKLDEAKVYLEMYSSDRNTQLLNELKEQ